MGREVAGRATKSREVPRYIKSDERPFLKDTSNDARVRIPGFSPCLLRVFSVLHLLFAALDVFLRILRSSPVYKNHYTNSQILFPSGTHKLVLNEFLSTLWCFLGKQIVCPFCFVAR